MIFIPILVFVLARVSTAYIWYRDKQRGLLFEETKAELPLPRPQPGGRGGELHIEDFHGSGHG